MTTQRLFKTKLVLLNLTVVACITSLPRKEACQVLDKIKALMQDPSADGKTKIVVKHMPGNTKLFRARSGHYRIFYTFNERKVYILNIRKRDEDTYKDDVDVVEDLNNNELEDLDIEEFDDLDVDEEEEALPMAFVDSVVGIGVEDLSLDQQHAPAPKEEGRVLPKPITVELLNQLHVPPEYHQHLLSLKTEEELLACASSGIGDGVLWDIIGYMVDSPLKQTAPQSISSAQTHHLLHRPIKLRLCFRKKDAQLYTNKNGQPFNVLVTLRMR